MSRNNGKKEFRKKRDNRNKEIWKRKRYMQEKKIVL